ncbi:tetratricopeptide repeat protein [candidate division KSB1 bacterium]|nr:tetratricopeptide repeat protein [candidate division KSB1 bacterium]
MQTNIPRWWQERLTGNFGFCMLIKLRIGFYQVQCDAFVNLAIDLLEEHRQLLRPLFSKHKGKEIEAIGDAFFVEFNSALESVSCAIEIQKTLHERNLKIDTEKQIKIRIGLHIGDVVHIGKHVHGDGVNIAARLEPLSAPGGICLSEDVARQIKNKIDLPVKNLGPQKLKNIQSTIDVYCIQFPWESKQKIKLFASPVKFFLQRNVVSFILILFAVIAVLFIWNKFQLTSIKELNNRIAVLPLVNISQDNEDDYFAEGMTEELISQLAKISGLSVIARTSVMKYKNTQMNIKEIGRELDVGTILEGSVRKTSDKARITIQLIDVETQEHLWVEDYDRELKDIFEMQSEIALRIANELKIQLLSTEKQQIEKRNTENAEAFRSYLMGKYQLNNRTPESLKNALKYFNTAVSLDPNYALAYVGLTDCYTLISGAAYGYIPREEAIQKANDAIRKAIEIDPTSAEAYNSLAYLKFRLEWDWEEAENYFKKAIELKPGYSSAYERYALYLALLGRNKESIQLMNHAYELDPLNPSVSTGVGRMYHFAKQFDKAIKQYEETLQMNPDYVETVFALGMSNSVLGNYDRAIQQLKRAIELSNGRLIIITFLARTYAAAGMIEEAKKLQEELIQLQSEKNVSPFKFSVIDAALGNEDAAIDSLYKAYDEHFGILVYLKASPLFEKLFDHPRFYELLRKIGLEK